MAKRSEADPVVAKLDAILSVLQDMLILQSANAGIKRDSIRRIIPVGTHRISRITQHMRRSKNQVE